MKLKKILTALSLAVIVVAGSSISANASSTDPNGDGVLNIFDSVYIAKYINGKICPTDLSSLDYDGNGIIS